MISVNALQNLTEVMRMMAATERFIAEFYRTCAELWPEDRDFWLDVVAEEEKHARNIEEMAKIVSAKPERFELGRAFNPAAIRTVMTGIEGQVDRLKKGLITRDRLMIVARDIEASVMEKSYREIVRTTDLEYLNLVKEIVEDTSRHKSAIEKRCEEISAQGKGATCTKP